MRKNIKRALLVTCLVSLQILKPATSISAKTLALTYDGKQHIYNKPPITLEIDKNKIEMDMPPVQIDGRTLVPTREIFEPMGASVEWKEKEKKIFINHGDKLIVLEVNNSNGWVEGELKKLDAPPKIINNKVMLPLRFISETLGYNVDWDEKNSHISINQIMAAPDFEAPTINVPKLKTKVKDVKIRNRGDDLTVCSIYLDSPLETYSYFTQDGKVVVDIDSAENLLDSRMSFSDNPVVEVVRTSQYTPEKTRVVFDLVKEVKPKVELSSDKRVITLTMETVKSENMKPDIPKPEDIITDIPKAEDILPNIPTPEIVVPKPNIPKPEESKRENFKYTNSPKESIVFKKVNGLSFKDIQIKDDYRNRKITVTLPGNYSDMYQDGLITVSNGVLEKILIKSNNKTEFIIHSKKIRAYEVIDDGENITIQFVDPREKYKKIILLDLGHGGSDSGASGNGLVEKKVIFEQGMALYELLENDPNIKVYITREDDSYPTNPARAQLANEIGADIFVSLHNNAFTNANANGTEVLYSTKSTKSKQMAQIIQTKMVRELGTFDRKIKARPKLIVLNQTKMPAVLVETAFLTNPGDAAKMKSTEFNKKTGRVIYDSIVEIFNTISFR